MQLLTAALLLALPSGSTAAPTQSLEPKGGSAHAQDPQATQRQDGERAEAPPAQAAEPRIGPGPWQDDLVLLRSQGGSSWEEHGVLVPHASVPSVCRMADERLLLAFQWFPFDRPEAFDRVALAFSSDDGQTWTDPEPISLEGLPDGQRRPADPCVVALGDGRLRMYFTSHERKNADTGGFEAGGWPATWSAVSSDGLAWTFEPGRRFGVEGQSVIDPTVVRFRGEWHYFAPIGDRDGLAFHAVSRDGLEFQRWPEVEVQGAGRWLGCALSEAEYGEPDAILRFYGTGRVGWSATSRDTRQWRLDGRVVWSQGADPAVARTQNDALLMIATAPGQARRDAEAALLAAMSGGPTVAMTANDRFLYVLRGETIYMFEASTLRFLRMKRLPELEQDEGREPGREDPLPGEVPERPAPGRRGG